MRDFLIAAVLAVIMLLNFLDVLHDISLGVPRAHIIEESLIVIAAAAGFIYIIWEMRKRTREMRTLAATLSTADRQLHAITEEMRRERRHYSEAIRRQFADWDLTRSEQQVALLMLKGLSLKEIAAVRDTREKTVRQQASSIYDKSGLEGRHALAAWFLEDFIAPDTG